MFWLYLLGIVTFLIIVLRRVLRRQKPLSDELYAKKVAIDHVHSGVAWVPEDGRLGWMNPALPEALQIGPKDLIGHDWYELFADDERERMHESYRQMLLMGKVSLQVRGSRADGTFAWFDVLLVAVHDHRMRFVGHHCLIENRTREHLLEQRLHEVAAEIVTVQPELEQCDLTSGCRHGVTSGDHSITRSARSAGRSAW